jgi:hypothetical protein
MLVDGDEDIGLVAFRFGVPAQAMRNPRATPNMSDFGDAMNVGHLVGTSRSVPSLQRHFVRQPTIRRASAIVLGQ